MNVVTFFQQEASTQKNLLKGFEMVREISSNHFRDIYNRRTGNLEGVALSTEKLEEVLKKFNTAFGLDIDLYELGYRISK